MMATFFGLDNRELLPPFIPATRGADYIFGITVSRCFDELFFAHPPWSLLYLPVEARTFSRGEITRSASGVDVDALVSTLIQSCKFGGERQGAVRIKQLGRHLEELGALPEGQFEEFARAEVMREMNALAGHLEDRLGERGGAPAYWGSDVQKCARIMRQATAWPDVYLPARPALWPRSRRGAAFGESPRQDVRPTAVLVAGGSRSREGPARAGAPAGAAGLRLGCRKWRISQDASPASL